MVSNLSEPVVERVYFETGMKGQRIAQATSSAKLRRQLARIRVCIPTSRLCYVRDSFAGVFSSAHWDCFSLLFTDFT
jgi:hypothetical protein